MGYDEGELAGVPEGADLGLGCGNPVALASLAPGETVLDLGSGGGIDCFLAAGRVGPEGRVIGVDMTPEMLERARGNAQPRAATGTSSSDWAKSRRCRSRTGPSTRSSPTACSHLSANRPRVLAEVRRVLKPGGRVMISDLVSERAVPAFVAASRESLVGCLPVRVREYEEDLAAAGFVEISVEPRQRYPGGHILADPQVQAVIRGDPGREAEVRAFVESIHGGAIVAVKGGGKAR